MGQNAPVSGPIYPSLKIVIAQVKSLSRKVLVCLVFIWKIFCFLSMEDKVSKQKRKSGEVYGEVPWPTETSLKQSKKVLKNFLGPQSEMFLALICDFMDQSSGKFPEILFERIGSCSKLFI